MRYTIITPSLVRPTLKRLCDSIDAQTNGDWEHIVAVDKGLKDCTELDRSILKSVEDPRRRFHFYEEKHANDCGNSARRKAFPSARGEYIFYIDDDDYLADNKVLETLSTVTADWAIFPVLSRGNRCFHNPPGIHRTGSCMFISKRECKAVFPANNDYAADGQVVEALKKRFKYQSLGEERPLVIYEQANHGNYEIIPEALRKREKKHRIVYGSDGLTRDWNDYN